MTSGRKLLAEALSAALPAFAVVSTTRQLDTVKKPGALVIWTQKREKVPALGLDWFTDEVVLQVLTAAEKPEAIEDDLDELLLEVLEVLEPLDAFTWNTAERVAIEDTFNGWQLTVTCIFRMTTEPEPDPEPEPENTEEN